MRNPITAARQERAKVVVLVSVYFAAIVTANIITARYGPTASIYNAFALIGLDLITRDRLSDFWGTSRWRKMALLIGAGVRDQLPDRLRTYRRSPRHRLSRSPARRPAR